MSAQVGLIPSKPDKIQPPILDSNATSIKSDGAQSNLTSIPSSLTTIVSSVSPTATAAGEVTTETGKMGVHEQKEASKEQTAEGEALVAYLQGQRCLEDMLEELSESASVAQISAAQLAELMMYPVDRFLRADLDGEVLVLII